MTKKQKLEKWNEVKYRLSERKGKLPGFQEGEVWWCAVGENIGVEMYGKSEKFSRPVLIYKKYNQYSFMALLMTSQEKSGNRFVKIRFHGQDSYVVLIQARTMSVNRLYEKIGSVDDTDFMKVKNAFTKFFR